MFKSENYYRAKSIFGDELEIAELSDQRVPLELRAIAQELHVPTLFNYLCVPCGTTRKLCAIWFPVFNPALTNAMQLFFKYNPKLRDTAIIQWQKFVTVWLHIDGWRPVNKFVSGIFWFGSGLLPLVTAKEERRDGPVDWGNIFPLEAHPAMTIKFSEIIWPVEVHDIFLLERLESQHGKLFLDNVSNKTHFGSYTAAHFIKEIYLLKYNHSNGRFTLFENVNRSQIDNDELRHKIREWLSDQANNRGARYPRGKPEAVVINVLKKICPPESAENRYGLALPTSAIP